MLRTLALQAAPELVMVGSCGIELPRLTVPSAHPPAHLPNGQFDACGTHSESVKQGWPSPAVMDDKRGDTAALAWSSPVWRNLDRALGGEALMCQCLISESGYARSSAK